MLTRSDTSIDLEKLPFEVTESPPPAGVDVLRPAGLGERVWSRLEWGVSHLVGHDLNPLAHSGTLATLCFLLVLASGLYLFLVYDVAAPYASVLTLDSSIVGSTMRGVHRFASRGLMLFAVIHALRLGLAGRFRGPRWLAWETGLVQVVIVWFLGVTGYLLVWDDQAQVVGTAVATLLDSVAIFVQPFRLTLLANETVRDNIFFVVLFLHISVPLAAALFYLLHLSRVSRPQWLPARPLIAIYAIVTLAIALLWRVRTTSPADLSQVPGTLALDPWYSSFILVSDPLWLALAALSGPFVLFALLPALRRRRQVTATVHSDACRGCRLCANDCPYGAIAMVPAPADRVSERVTEVAVVNLDRCVGCGICLGSCNFQGISLAHLSGSDLKAQFVRHGELLRGINGPGVLVVACRWSGVPRLPEGCRFLPVPCAGAVNRTMLSATLTAGASGVLIATCGDALCAYREGGLWTRLRATRERQPGWLHRFVERVRLVEIRTGDEEALASATRAFQGHLSGTPWLAYPWDGHPEPSSPLLRERVGSTVLPGPLKVTLAGVPWPHARVAAAILLASFLMGITVLDVPYAPQASDDGLLKVGVRTEAPLVETRTLSAEQMAGRLEHMRGQELVNRERLPIQVVVWIDGQPVLDSLFQARGFRHDGPTYGYAEVRLAPGSHQIEARVHAGSDAAPPLAELRQTVEVAPRQVRVLSYGALGEGLSLR